MTLSLNATAKVCALLVFVVAGMLLAGRAGFGPGEPGAEASSLHEIRKLLASDAQAYDYFGRSVAVSGDTAIVGAHEEDAGGNRAGAAYVFQRNQGGADNWGQVTKLTASDPQVDGYFGGSVTISGDTVIVGSTGAKAGGIRTGAAYVFQRNEGGIDKWGEVKKLTASDAQAGDNFGLSVAVSGDTIIVGAAGAGYISSATRAARTTGAR